LLLSSIAAASSRLSRAITYTFAVAYPDEAATILVEANNDMLTHPAFVRASMRALVEGNYLARPDGTVGEIDRGKVEVMGGFLLMAGILHNANRGAQTTRPNFGDYFSDDLATAYRDSLGAGCRLSGSGRDRRITAIQ
jgi:hypothetical protein